MFPLSHHRLGFCHPMDDNMLRMFSYFVAICSLPVRVGADVYYRCTTFVSYVPCYLVRLFYKRHIQLFISQLLILRIPIIGTEFTYCYSLNGSPHIYIFWALARSKKFDNAWMSLCYHFLI
jgi:hypothetical protein